MKKQLLAVFSLFLLGASADAQAQMNIFGYFQSTFAISNYDETNTEQDATNFNLQQLNLLGSSAIGDDFTAFVNLELTNNLDTRTFRGAIKLEEAWMKYRDSREFQIKAGLLVPTFNQLNEQKTKFPLLPWITRPLVYEASLYNILDPEHA